MHWRNSQRYSLALHETDGHATVGTHWLSHEEVHLVSLCCTPDLLQAFSPCFRLFPPALSFFVLLGIYSGNDIGILGTDLLCAKKHVHYTIPIAGDSHT